jgi:molybdate-binding protein/DNA-binding XRE family transcriptional regulator
VKQFRLERGWTQEELAVKARISRTAISAIEMRRIVPSVAAAMSIALAFGCRVESLFGGDEQVRQPAWSWPPRVETARYWEAEVQGRRWLYPVEWSGMTASHDGVVRDGRLHGRGRFLPEQTLVLASCDPAAALLVEEYSRVTPFRMLSFGRSSQDALELLKNGRAHVAGVHLAKAGDRRGNSRYVRDLIGPGYRVMPVARWESGIAVAPAAENSSVKEIAKSSRRWVGREKGSGARKCQDELLEKTPPPAKLARDHRGVANVIRSGFADFGICVRLVAEDTGLGFVGVRKDAYDVVFRKADAADPRIEALVRVLESTSYRQMLSELPGYQVHK